MKWSSRANRREKYEKFGNTTVFGRPGQPAELASIYVQLAADDASFHWKHLRFRRRAGLAVNRRWRQ
jgi:hypothetical protein